MSLFVDFVHIVLLVGVKATMSLRHRITFYVWIIYLSTLHIPITFLCTPSAKSFDKTTI